MRALWVGLALAAGAAVLCGPAPRAAARPVLLPNAGALPGELGYLMGGAQVALASSGEALWYNPAGLALETGTRLTASGSPARLQHAQADGPATDSADSTLDGLAYAHALGGHRGYPRFTLGLTLLQAAQQRLDTPTAATRQGTEASLPPGTLVPGGSGSINSVLPGGFAITDSGEALGELRILAPGVGLGIAAADWLRVGLAVQVQRLALDERAAGTSAYSGGATLDGQSQLAWVLAGDALRWTGTLGVQMELTPGVVLGIALVLPSETLRGSGRVLYQRNDELTLNAASTSDTVVIARNGLPFRLETPQRLQVGLAFRSDRFLVELDLYRLARQAAYEVLPATVSQPPSDIAFVLPALRTSGVPVVGTALGLAWAQSEHTSLLLAIAQDPSPVPPDDPLFRSVAVTTLSAGAYHVRGDASLSAGLVWREARAAGVLMAPPDGGQPVTSAVALREVALRMGGSLAF
jgi:hypothetical protein